MANALARLYTKYVDASILLRRSVFYYTFISLIGIVVQIGHVTCDNASNNNTMMAEFAKQYERDVGKAFNVKSGHIR